MKNNYQQSYSQYKYSGEPWLGDIPSHWKLVRTKSILAERITKGFPNEPLLAATQTKGVVRKEQYENRTVLALKDLHLLKLVQKGDFVISLRSFQGGIEYAREQGIISPAYTILFPKVEDYHGYLAWLFKSKPYIENLTLYVTGIRQGQNIDYEKLSRSYIPLPPLDEQRAIVRYLDHMNRLIQRYIRAKQKQIKLLEEQKQTIIHQAVTRGLGPNVPIKSSGVEWLGDIPEHWEVKRLKSLGQAIIGLTYDPNDVVEENQGVLVLRASNVVDGRIKLEDNIYVKAKIPELIKLRENDILICARSGSRALIGKNVKINRDLEGATFGAFMLVFRSEHYDYLYHIFNSQLFEYQSGMFSTSTINQLTKGDIYNFYVPIPPGKEQSEIVDYLNRTIPQIDTNKSHLEAEITLIREYHTSLISDVITGKLDVREIAARLPVEEIDQALEIDEELSPDNEEEQGEMEPAHLEDA